MTAGLPLMKCVPTPSAKSAILSSGLSGGISAAFKGKFMDQNLQH